MRFARRLPLFLACLSLFICPAATAGTAHDDSAFMTVRWVDDGDTVVLQDGRRIRYIGIDAPEVAHGKKTAQPYGNASRRFNRKMVGSKKVRLESDVEKTDAYGRYLAYIFLPNGTFVNKEMLSRGYAVYYWKTPNTAHSAELLSAQRNAMEQGRGIWKIWKNVKIACIGNRHSKRFHTPACPFAKHIRFENKIKFETTWEAFQEGYSPCRKCIAR